MRGVEFNEHLGRLTCPPNFRGAHWVELANLYMGENPGFMFAAKHLVPHLLGGYVQWHDEVMESIQGRPELEAVMDDHKRALTFHDGVLNACWWQSQASMRELPQLADWPEARSRLEIPVVDVYEAVRTRQSLGDPMYAADITPHKLEWTETTLQEAVLTWEWELLKWPRWCITGNSPPYVPFSIDLGEHITGLPQSMEFPSAQIDLYYGRFYLWDGVKDPGLSALFFDYLRNLKDAGKIDIDDEYRKKSLEAIYAMLPGKVGNLLVLACGDGEEAPFFPQAQNIWGVDVSPNMLAHANLTGAFDRLILQDASHLDKLMGEWADVVVMAYGLHWFDDQEALFGSVRQVIRPGGMFVFNVRRPETDWQLQLRPFIEAGGGHVEFMEDMDLDVYGKRVRQGLVRVRYS